MKESRYNVWVARDGAKYIFNGVSGSLLRVSNRDQDALQRFVSSGTAEDCSLDLLDKLTRGRMLIADDADELAMLERRYQAGRHDAVSFALTIVTSLGCNFDCPYCFEAKHTSIMREDVQRAVLRVVDDQLGRIKNFAVTWFGGEPLVGKKALLALSDEFIERADRAKINYTAHLTTNGYLLDETTCRQLRERRVIGAQICLDGPPAVHDRMRPLANGKGTFWRIIENLHHAVEHFDVAVRMNVDKENIGHATELFEILVSEGFVGKLSVYPGQIVGVNADTIAPSSGYGHRCFASRDFARAELEFKNLAKQFGLSRPASLPGPTAAPCTAVRANELVVGSDGELYKCWDTVGHKMEVIGDISDYGNPNTRLQKWLRYDPFQDQECRSCIALPVCMGGCAHHAMEKLQYENRCMSFRYTYKEQIAEFVENAEQGKAADSAPIAMSVRRMDTR